MNNQNFRLLLLKDFWPRNESKPNMAAISTKLLIKLK